MEKKNKTDWLGVFETIVNNWNFPVFSVCAFSTAYNVHNEEYAAATYLAFLTLYMLKNIKNESTKIED